MRTVKAMARLRGCAGSPEPSLFAYVINSIYTKSLLISGQEFLSGSNDISGEGVENVLDDILQGHTNEDELNTVETDNVEESPADAETSELTIHIIMSKYNPLEMPINLTFLSLQIE